ncbi:MAG: hypothetical protein CVU05_13145 [Bacteroidetes bacterium HGW-Bacteroidetes-21]|jgi:hypothetical protein|nr:MAG: hypothetical protein CVU05_13145 [Bacteroidetes bacterium HGW-Bacteroidetes-21]
MRKYYIIVVVAVIMYGVGIALSLSLDVYPPLVNWFFIGFFALYSILFIYLLNRSMIIKPKAFINRFLMLSSIKLLASMFALAIILYFVQEFKILTGMVFLTSFLVFLFVEVITILEQLKKNRIKNIK